MKLTSASFGDNQRIPGAYAFAVPHATEHISLSSNRNPQLSWSGAPAAAKSFVLICHDRDVPSKGDDVNKEGRSIPAALPRVDFYHWVLVAPHAADAVRDRGLAYYKLDCFRAALADLQDYLQRRPDAPDAEEIKDRVAALRLACARLN